MRPLVRLLALVLGAALLPAPVAAAAQEPASRTLADRVRALQADVDEAGRALEAGARTYQQGERRLAELTQQQFAVAQDLDGLSVAGTRTQSGVDALVRAAYKGSGVPPVVTALLSGDPRTLSDLARVQATVDRADSSHRADLARLVATRERTARLLQRKAALRRQALAQQQEVDRHQREVSAAAALQAERLTRTAQALGAALAREAEQARLRAEQARQQAEALAAARAAAARSATEQQAVLAAAAISAAAVVGPALPTTGTGGCAPAAPHGYANGFLPDAVLCALPGRPFHRLRTDAARSFAAMDAARTAAGLPALCLTDSYRDYLSQVSVFARKPHLAAVPGRSQHGWGLALDLCGGAERFDGEAHLWLRANAPSFGWVHPAWAEPGGSRPEAWHWEFLG